MVADTERALVRQLQSLPQAYISHFAIHERCASLRCIALGISIDCLASICMPALKIWAGAV